MHSNPGSPRTHTRNLSFSYLGRGGFSPNHPPDLVTPKRKGSASGTRTTSPALRKFRAPGGGRGARVGGVTPPPGYLTPAWSPRGAGRSRSSLLAPALPPPHSLRASPTLLPALASRAGIGRRARGAGRRRRSPLPSRPLAAAAARCPDRATRVAASRLPAPSARDSPSRTPAPTPRRRVGCRGRPANSQQHGFGFRRAERWRARDRRYRGDGWGREKGKPGQEITSISRSSREGGRSPAAPVPYRPGLGIAPRCEFALGLSLLLHLGAQEGEDVRLRVTLRFAGLLRRPREALAGQG